MDGDLAQLSVEGSDNHTTIILNGTSYVLPSLTVDTVKLENPSSNFEESSDTSLVAENGILVETTSRGSCRLFYVPVRDTINESQLMTTEQLLNQQTDITESDPSNIFDVSQELVQTQLASSNVNEDSDVQSNSQATKEPIKKRKGGWPKGKKRKKEVQEPRGPKAPTTGYVLFLNERRQFYKESHPELPFFEVTKVLGNEWSNLPLQEKQKYLDEAEADKKRYREELKAYQQSEAYQAYLKRKRLKHLCNSNPETADSETDPPLVLDDIDDETESDELYCKVCNQFFNSLHNKKEHLYGRHHLQAITGEFQKETTANSQNGSEEDSLVTGDSDLFHRMISPSLGLGTSAFHSNAPSNLTQAICDFMDLTLLREVEIRELRKQLEQAKGRNQYLCKEIQNLKEMENRMQEDLKNLKSYGVSLNTQLENLRIVPTLFGVINF